MSDGSEAPSSCVASSEDEYIPSKASMHGSGSEGSDKLKKKVPFVKRKKQKMAHNL